MPFYIKYNLWFTIIALLLLWKPKRKGENQKGAKNHTRSRDEQKPLFIDKKINFFLSSWFIYFHHHIYNIWMFNKISHVTWKEKNENAKAQKSTRKKRFDVKKAKNKWNKKSSWIKAALNVSNIYIKMEKNKKRAPSRTESHAHAQTKVYPSKKVIRT